MSTLLTDLSIPLPPQTADSTPEVMPYAITGTTAAPSLARETNGWQSGVIPPAPQENWFRQNIWAWMGRASCTGFFTQRSTVGVTMGGVPVAGDVLRLSYNGMHNDYVMTTAGAANLNVAAAQWAQQLTLDAALRDSLDAQGSTLATMLVFYRAPGTAWPHAVTVSSVSGTTTVALTDIYGGSGAPLLVTSSAGGGDGLTLQHQGAAQFGTDCIVSHVNEIASAMTTSNGPGTAQQGTVMGTVELSGVSTGAIENATGGGVLFEATHHAGYQMDIQVVAHRTNSTGAVATTWNLHLNVTRSTSGTAVITTFANDEVVTISGTDYVLGKVYTTGVNLTPFADTTGGKLTLQLDATYSSYGVVLLAGCTDAGYTATFVATCRYTTST